MKQVCRLRCMHILPMPSTLKDVCCTCCFCALLLITSHCNIKPSIYIASTSRWTTTSRAGFWTSGVLITPIDI